MPNKYWLMQLKAERQRAELKIYRKFIEANPGVAYAARLEYLKFYPNNAGDKTDPVFLSLMHPFLAYDRTDDNILGSEVREFIRGLLEIDDA